MIERKLVIQPAYDKRHPDPKKNYGIHGVTMTWYVIGPLGAVQFILYTNWQLKHVRKEMRTVVAKVEHAPHLFHEPLPADIGYHSPKPFYDGQTARTCHLLPEGKCYYDGSSLNAEQVFDVLCEGGDEALWNYLEKYYEERFHDGHHSTEQPDGGSTGAVER